MAAVLAMGLWACGGGDSSLSGVGGAASASGGGGQGGADPRAEHCPAPLEGANARVFALGHRLDGDDAQSYASFREAHERPLDKVLPCLRSGVSNVLLYPAESGRLAMLLGSRGEAARKTSTAAAALAALETSYQAQMEFFALKHPELNARQQLLLATSNVVWRATAETWSGIAKEHGVWVLGSVHSPAMVRTAAPYLVELLSDPDDPKTGQVFYPSTTTVKAVTLLFDPKGKLVGRWEQVALSQEQQDERNLLGAGFASLRVAQGPFGNVAVAAGRDALIPAVYDRLDALGAALLFQPMALAHWPGLGGADKWLPDRVTAAGWLATQRHAGIEGVVASVRSGRFFEVPYDGQSFVSAKVKPGDTAAGFVGQTEYAGYQALGTWHREDPTDQELAKRRETLLTEAAELAKSGGYQDAVAIVDLAVQKAAAVAVKADPSQPPSRAATAQVEEIQTRPSLASDGQDRVVLTWQQGRGSNARIYAATSQDGGLSFGDAAEVLPNADYPQERRRPHICMHSDGRNMLVFQEGRPGYERIVASLRNDNSEPFAEVEYVDLGGSPQWQARCGFLDAASVGVVFVDLRSGRAKIRFGRRAWLGSYFDSLQWVDEGATDATGLEGQQLQPSLANEGGHIAYAGYGEHGWSIFYSRWDANNAELLKSVLVSGESKDGLHGEPSIAASAGDVVIGYSDLTAFGGQPDVAYLRSTDGGLNWSNKAFVAGGAAEKMAIQAGGQGWARMQPKAMYHAGQPQLFFQGLAAAKSAIYRMGADMGVSRVDDSGTSPNQMTHVVARRVRDATLLAWEDSRDGKTRIYVSRIKDE